jgi:hypothetical protein
MKMILIAIGALAAGAALAGCGATVGTTPPAVSSAPTSSAAASPVATPANPALQAAVEAYSSDYLGGNGAGAFALLSSRCQLAIGSQQLDAEANAAAALYGALPISSFTVDSINGTQATVSYTYAVATLDQSNQPWVLEAGAWRYDNC